MIQAILFDVDGVLVDSLEANIAFYQGLFSKAGYPKPSRDEVLANFHKPVRQVLLELSDGNHTEADRVFKMLGDADIRFPELYTFPQELEEVLEALHRKYRLAIVTSRTWIGLEEIFGVKEIRHLFDVIIAFEDVVKTKPDPEPLLVALERLDVTAADALYIGDSHSDVDAAQAAGMRSIHLSQQPHADATAVIGEFKELLEAIESLR